MVYWKRSKHTEDRSRTWVSRLFRNKNPVGQNFGTGFSWSEALDIIAHIYNGVGLRWRIILIVAPLINCIVRLLVNVDVPRAYGVV